MATKAEVRHAKEALKAKLGRPPWLRGIGIGGEPGDYCLKVNVAAITNDVRLKVPKAVEGVPVTIEAVGTIRPLTP